MKSLCVPVVFALLSLVLAASVGAQDYSWQKPHVKVLPTGDLEWAPEPFQFQPGESVKYIDYEAGDDANPGTKVQPWKHHPWDAKATGNARTGKADTFVFKGGVTYRGSLKVPEGASAHLTRDPSWGQGMPWLVGSRVISGWEKSAHPKMPRDGAIHAAEVEGALPRSVWMVDGEGKVTRLKLARTPNWTVSDTENYMSEWWSWDQPQWWKSFQGQNPNTMDVNGKTFHLGIDKKHMPDVGPDAVGGYVWTEWGIPTGGEPYPAKIQAYNERRQGIAFGGPWFEGAGGMVAAGHRYYLEDRPQWLDQAGEYWFDKTGPDGGTLYVWLPGDANPANVTIEAADELRLIDAGSVGSLEVSGLGFRFTNVLWRMGEVQFGDQDVKAGAIRLWGNADLVDVRNCRFEHVQLALRAQPNDDQTMEAVRFTDNEAAYTDHGVVEISPINLQGSGRIIDVAVLRNRMHDIAMRGARGRYSVGIQIRMPLKQHVAGNIINRVGAQGINVYGGKLSGQTGSWPYSRIIVHHNKVVDSLLRASDWAGIEMWQGGPFYVYNNVSGAPQGLIAFNNKRFGFAYYYDGGFKGYTFNNIAWARQNEPADSPLASKAAFQAVLSFQNSFFNNSIYNFTMGWHRQSPAGGRNKYLGNIVQDISKIGMVLATQAKEEEAINAGHFREGDTTDYETNAFADNVFFDVAAIGVYQVKGLLRKTIEEFNADVEKFGHTGPGDVGVMASTAPMPNADKQDFRPAPGSGVEGRGARMFVPWALKAVVGEWNFTPNNKEPDRIVDESWFMTEAYTSRDLYYATPRYPLTRQGESEFVDGPLESWTTGALQLKGEEQYLRLPHELLAEPFEVEITHGRGRRATKEQVVLQGDRKPTVDMSDNSFLVEAYFRTDAADGVLVCKQSGDTGYVLGLNDDGAVELVLKAGGRTDRVVGGKVGDGEWHHVVAEVDRKNATARLCVDGKQSAESKLAIGQASLSNTGDFLVGRAEDGQSLPVTLEFLRVSRGTLADAYTTIEELYAWEFGGPQYRDFTGTERPEEATAGAIELQ